jgi:Asp-tRNA(Asn)/Glu-tRNA(Gln) amidotransferase C subunit
MMREDRINDPDALTREAILTAAPETKDGSIKVKSIL